VPLTHLCRRTNPKIADDGRATGKGQTKLVVTTEIITLERSEELGTYLLTAQVPKQADMKRTVVEHEESLEAKAIPYAQNNKTPMLLTQPTIALQTM
jgi:hypothetical protein